MTDRQTENTEAPVADAHYWFYFRKHHDVEAIFTMFLTLISVYSLKTTLISENQRKYEVWQFLRDSFTFLAQHSFSHA